MSYFDTTTDHSVFGGSALRLVGDNTPPNVVTGPSNTIPVAGRDSIVVSAYVFVESIVGATVFTGKMEYFDVNNNSMGTTDWVTLNTPNGQFQRYYSIQDVTKFPKDTVAIKLSFSLFEPGMNPNGIVYVDCVKCEYGNKLTGYSESVFYEEVCQHIGGFGVPKIGNGQIDKDVVTSEELTNDYASLDKITDGALQYDGNTFTVNTPLNACNGIQSNGTSGITQTIEVQASSGGKLTIEITDGLITSIT